jgi:hypothetical protein
MICNTCQDDNPSKRDQLLCCTACRLHYHTACFGARRIPFSLNTLKERQNRVKYINKVSIVCH